MAGYQTLPQLNISLPRCPTTNAHTLRRFLPQRIFVKVTTSTWTRELAVMFVCTWRHSNGSFYFCSASRSTAGWCLYRCCLRRITQTVYCTYDNRATLLEVVGTVQVVTEDDSNTIWLFVLNYLCWIVEKKMWQKNHLLNMHQKIPICVQSECEWHDERGGLLVNQLIHSRIVQQRWSWEENLMSSTTEWLHFNKI